MQEENIQNFEEKIKMADKILSDLNNKDVSLEQSIKLHEQGKKLLKEAREILKNAELSIEEIGDE
ncbi:MAG: exodeoxyribonuclease VII small subunit [Campylobacter sp.]|nr:exodeoxyribonuclease VII small subunit [Campylobacter sp.]